MYMCGCVTKDSYGVGSLVLLGRQTKKHKKCLCGQNRNTKKVVRKETKKKWATWGCGQCGRRKSGRSE